MARPQGRRFILSPAGGQEPPAGILTTRSPLCPGPGRGKGRSLRREYFSKEQTRLAAGLRSVSHGSGQGFPLPLQEYWSPARRSPLPRRSSGNHSPAAGSPRRRSPEYPPPPGRAAPGSALAQGSCAPPPGWRVRSHAHRCRWHPARLPRVFGTGGRHPHRIRCRQRPWRSPWPPGHARPGPS